MIRPRDWETWALYALIVLMVGLNVADTSALGRVASCIGLVIASLAYGSRRTVAIFREQMDEMGKVPSAVEFHENDDGSCTALVQRLNGEPLVVTVPADIAERGSDAVAAYVLHEALNDVTE